MQRYRPVDSDSIEGWIAASFDMDPMAPDPSGEWFHELDPMWASLWVYQQLPETEGVEPVYVSARRIGMVRADVLLSLDRAFRAWGGIE